MLYTFNPILGMLAILAAGTLAYLAFRILDRHEDSRQ
jgi:hypothetical protein